MKRTSRSAMLRNVGDSLTPPGRRLASVTAALAFSVATLPATAALPRDVSRAFLDAKVPLNGVAIVVQEVSRKKPLFTHHVDEEVDAGAGRWLDVLYRKQAQIGLVLTELRDLWRRAKTPVVDDGTRNRSRG